MWIYEKRLEYPVNITKPDPRMAKLLMAQYGGPDSEMYANKGQRKTRLCRRAWIDVLPSGVLRKRVEKPKAGVGVFVFGKTAAFRDRRADHGAGFRRF